MLYKAGVPVVLAIRLVSGACAFLAMMLLYKIARERISTRLAFALPPLVMVLGAREIARMPTPDAMAFLAIVTCAWLLVRRHPALLAVLPLLVGVRSDLILFGLLCLVYLAIWNKLPRGWIMVSGVASVVLWIALGRIFITPAGKPCSTTPS